MPCQFYNKKCQKEKLNKKPTIKSTKVGKPWKTFKIYNILQLLRIKKPLWSPEDSSYNCIYLAQYINVGRIDNGVQNFFTKFKFKCSFE